MLFYLCMILHYVFQSSLTHLLLFTELSWLSHFLFLRGKMSAIGRRHFMKHASSDSLVIFWQQAGRGAPSVMPWSSFFINRGQCCYTGAALRSASSALGYKERKVLYNEIILEAEQQSPRNFWKLNIFQCLSWGFCLWFLCRLSPFKLAHIKTILMLQKTFSFSYGYWV